MARTAGVQGPVLALMLGCSFGRSSRRPATGDRRPATGGTLAGRWLDNAAKEVGFANPYFTSSTETLVPGTGTVPGTVAKTWDTFSSSVNLTPAALCGAQPGKC